MLIDGVPTRTIRTGSDHLVEILDQTALPHLVSWVPLPDLAAAASAIATMQVRGAPLIGVTAAYGLALAMRADASDAALDAAVATLAATRPTAANLRWALDRLAVRLRRLPPQQRAEAAWHEAAEVADLDVAANTAIGEHALALLRDLTAPAGRPLSVMTHCNAGWLATVDRGTALSAVYAAHEAGLAVHVWVSETRPRNQGLLTVWELTQQGVPCTLIADNAAGGLLRSGQVDAVLVGADRIAANGDVANKVGTYLKALACADTGVPCYVLAPLSTIDPGCPCGEQIPIEERDGEEVRVVHGRDGGGQPEQVRLVGREIAVGNPAFDVTPARLVTAVVTERGVARPDPEGIAALLASAGR